MSKCKQCNQDIVSTGNRTKEYCSDRCRKAYARSNPDSFNPDKSKADIQSGQASLEDYYANPDRYAPRTNPELLNWGPKMTADQLASHKSKHRLPKYHNRVPIPGDWDYHGICRKVDGVWTV